MRILVLDIGNTRFKAALSVKGKLQPLSQTSFEELFSLDFDGLIFASVVPAVTKELLSKLKRSGKKIPCRRFNWEVAKKILPNVIDDTVLAPGDDRAANAYGLYRAGKFPCAAVDVGTAVTTEILDPQGRFIGGSIAPGFDLQFASLANGTAQLSKAGKDFKKRFKTGRTSAEAIRLGVERTLVLGTLAYLEEVFQSFGTPVKNLVFTGGGASAFKKAFPAGKSDPDFTLKALALAFQDERLF